MKKEKQLQAKKNMFIEAEIDKRTTNLIEHAEKLVNDTGIAGKRRKDKKENILEEHQLRNVINVANSTDTVAVVTNFIKYQIGRCDKDEKWQHNNFGQKLIDELSEGIVYKSVEEIMGETKQALKGETTEDDLRKIWCRLVRLYIGYLSRYFKYAQSMEGGDN